MLRRDIQAFGLTGYAKEQCEENLPEACISLSEEQKSTSHGGNVRKCRCDFADLIEAKPPGHRYPQVGKVQATQSEQENELHGKKTLVRGQLYDSCKPNKCFSCLM